MRFSPRAVRVGIVMALGLPALVIIMAGRSQAQFPKGGPKMPQPPVFQTVWTCLKCGKNIGTGAAPPATCPFCGVKIINGVGPANPPPNMNPQPKTNPMPPPANPNPNPNQANLAGTWTGSETLAGYGALTFQLQPGGQASMIDKDGNAPGTWSAAGNSVNVSFPNLGVFYTGTLNGNQISGTARNGKDTWNWTVSNPNYNKGANQPPPPPQNNPPPPPPVVNVAPPADPQPAPIVENRRSSNTGLIIGIVVGGALFGLVGLAVLGGGIYFLMSSGKKSPKRDSARNGRRRSRRSRSDEDDDDE